MSVSLTNSKIVKALTAALVSTTLLSGCVSASSKYQQKPVQKAPDYKEYTISIEEGVTTKSDIWSVLGQPHGYQHKIMRYSTRGYKMLINLEYIEKSGHKYHYQLHDRLPNSYLSISLDDNDVVESIHVY